MSDPYDPRSGLHVAEQAHDLGVVEPLEEFPVVRGYIEFAYHGTLEQAGRVTDLACIELGADDRVTFVGRSMSIEVAPVAQAGKGLTDEDVRRIEFPAEFVHRSGRKRWWRR